MVCVLVRMIDAGGEVVCCKELELPFAPRIGDVLVEHGDTIGVVQAVVLTANERRVVSEVISNNPDFWISQHGWTAPAAVSG